MFLRTNVLKTAFILKLSAAKYLLKICLCLYYNSKYQLSDSFIIILRTFLGFINSKKDIL